MERRARITVILAAITLLFVMLPAFAGQPLTASAQDTIAAPAEAEIAATTSEAGRVRSVPATWTAVEGAAGYYLTLCRIENGKWVEASDRITVESTEGQDTVSYDFKEYVEDTRSGHFGYKVRAYNSSGLTSEETKSSNTVEIYHISMGFQYTGISFIVAAGSNISALIKEAFETHIVSDFSIEDGEYYWYYHGEDHKILCFTKDRQYKYSSLAEMKAAALYVPGEDPKPAIIEKDQKVEAFSEDMLCEKTGDLHKWKGDVIRATTESSGHAVYTCEDCDASEEGEYYPRVAGFELEKSSYTFTGKAITPAVKVSDIYTEESGEYLREGKDYTVKYTNNTKAGTGKAEITLIGYYEGKATLTFRIKKADLSSAEISSISAKTYKGKAVKPLPVVKLGGVKLKNGTDFKVVYSGNTGAGKAKAYIIGYGSTTGMKTVGFKINKGKNPLSVKAGAPAVGYSELQKKAQNISAAKVLKFKKKGQGKVTYTKASGDSKITISKKTGSVTLKKGLKKGSYKLKIKVKAAGNANYKAGTKSVNVTIKVK